MDESHGDYSHHYSIWHDDSPAHVEGQVGYHARQLAPLLTGLRPGRALDIGCGMGFAVLALNQIGFDAEGIDRDPSQIEICRKLGVRAERTSEIGEFLRNKENYYDLVIMLDVLEHLPKSEHIPTLAAVQASLVNGGRIILTVPNALNLLAPYWRYIDWTHTTAFTIHSLSYVLKNAGLKDITFSQSGHQGRLPVRFWKKSVRNNYALRFARAMQRRVIAAELGRSDDVAKMPLDLNLTCVATK